MRSEWKGPLVAYLILAALTALVIVAALGLGWSAAK